MYYCFILTHNIIGITYASHGCRVLFNYHTILNWCYSCIYLWMSMQIQRNIWNNELIDLSYLSKVSNPDKDAALTLYRFFKIQSLQIKRSTKIGMPVLCKTKNQNISKIKDATEENKLIINKNLFAHLMTSIKFNNCNFVIKNLRNEVRKQGK